MDQKAYSDGLSTGEQNFRGEAEIPNPENSAAFMIITTGVHLNPILQGNLCV